MTELTTVADVVSALGGLNATGKIAGAQASSVANWRTLHRFPARTYLVLNSELLKRGLNAPVSLWGMAVPGAPVRKSRRRKRNGCRAGV